MSLLGAIGCSSYESNERPNLVLITVDTLRADLLGCYGGATTTGQALCQSLEDGIRYDWAFSTAPYTVPAVASIHTSLYPSQHKVSQFSSAPMKQELETLAERLSSVGYATAAFVSNPVLSANRNLTQGFDVYDDKMNRIERNRPGFSERSAEETTKAARRWLAAARGPWFLWVHYHDPHGPYEPPGASLAVDDAGGVPLRISKTPSGFQSIPSYQVLPDAVNFETYRDRYLDEINYLDGWVSALLSDVRERDAEAGVLLTADHGEALGEDGYFFSHGHSLGLDQIRVPLIWRPPGGAVPSSAGMPVSLIDIAPTLLAAAGVPAPGRWQGQALESGTEASSPQRVIFSEHPARSALIVGDRYYARDLRDLSRRTIDRNTGGRLRPIVTRQASLGDIEMGLPSYHDGESAELDALVNQSRSQDEAAEPGVLDDATRDRLRALGYIN